MHLPAMIVLQRNTLTSPRSVFKINYNNSSIVSVCSGHREPFHRSEFCIHLRASVLHSLLVLLACLHRMGKNPTYLCTIPILSH